MKTLRKDLPEPVEKVLKNGYIPFKRGYHASKKKRKNLDPETIYFGVEFEVDGVGESPVVVAMLKDLGFSCEHDATVSAEYVLPPILATEEKARELYTKLLDALKVAELYFENEVYLSGSCGFHHHFSVPKGLLFATTTRSSGRVYTDRWAVLNAMLWLFSRRVEDELDVDLRAENIFGRHFGEYRSYLRLYMDEEPIETMEGFYLMLDRDISPLAEIMDRHSWINFVNLNVDGIGTIEYRLPILQDTVKKNMRAFSVMTKLHELYLNIFKWVRKNVSNNYADLDIGNFRKRAISYCEKLAGKFETTLGEAANV